MEALNLERTLSAVESLIVFYDGGGDGGPGVMTVCYWWLRSNTAEKTSTSTIEILQ